jgi:hypothetical protein
MFSRLTCGRVMTHVAAATSGRVVGAGGLALAASGGGVLHACAAKTNGLLRLATKCTAHGRAVTWNAQGRPGPRGPKGGTGIRGPKGDTGGRGSPAASILTARTHAAIGQEGYFAASGTSTMSGTEADVAVLTPATTTIAQDLVVKDQVSSQDDNTRVYVLRVNSSDTALTCSIVAGAGSCTDSSHSATIPPGSEVTIHRALLTGTGGGADGTDVLAAWRATTP